MKEGEKKDSVGGRETLYTGMPYLIGLVST
jgi:hypothetical protein